MFCEKGDFVYLQHPQSGMLEGPFRVIEFQDDMAVVRTGTGEELTLNRKMLVAFEDKGRKND